VRNHRVKSGVETALYDLLAKSAGCPLYVLLGGLVRREITVIRMMSLADPEAMAAEAKSLVSEGIKALKLKIDGKLTLDYKRVESVRKAVGDDVFLKVDANEAYDAKGAIRMAQKLADLGVEIFEQPVPRNQIENLIDVKKHSPIKIEADQSVSTAFDAYRLIREGGIDAINTSPLKAGGISEVRKIAELCEIGGIQCALSNTAGSMTGDAAALHLAASLPSASTYCEIGEFEAITGDPFEGLRVENGILKVPDGPGLGVRLSDAK
jgi:L-alanine-DL-glutamate epimerase-like enolase superfamily enzyme